MDKKEKEGGRDGGKCIRKGAWGDGDGERGKRWGWGVAKVGWLMLFNDARSQKGYSSGGREMIGRVDRKEKGWGRGGGDGSGEGAEMGRGKRKEVGMGRFQTLVG